MKEKYFSKIYKDTKTLIDIVNDECDTYKCTPIFIFIPASDFWYNDKNQFIYRDHIANYLQAKKNIFLDFSEIIKFNDKSFYSLKGGHLSPDSYNILSKEIYKKIN